MLLKKKLNGTPLTLVKNVLRTFQVYCNFFSSNITECISLTYCRILDFFTIFHWCSTPTWYKSSTMNIQSYKRNCSINKALHYSTSCSHLKLKGLEIGNMPPYSLLGLKNQWFSQLNESHYLPSRNKLFQMLIVLGHITLSAL